MESSLHVVWECRYAKSVWGDADIGAMMEFPRVGNTRDWVGWWLTNLSVSERSSAAMIAWTCWNERNAVGHGSTPCVAAELNAAVASLLLAYREGIEGAKKGVGGDPQGRTRNREVAAVWQAPRVNVVKVNVDGACFKERGVGMGVVVRDQECLLL